MAFALARAQSRSQPALHDERLQFALDAAAMGTWELDLPSRSLAWSRNLERIHGYEPGAFARSFDSYLRIIHEPTASA